MRRVIAHVDMDAFFAAVEQRDNPALRGKPVVIGSDPKGGKGRGVVSTCSYEARKFGIRSAMPVSTAYFKCPSAVFLPVNMDKYCAVSEDIEKVLYSFTPYVEMISVDEGFLDVTGSMHMFKSVEDFCHNLKSRVFSATQLTCSVGCASTKLIAKMASEFNKPDGIAIVADDEIEQKIWPLDIIKMWGVGKKSADILRAAGFNTIGDLARAQAKDLKDHFGINAQDIIALARGQDTRPVCQDGEVKSVSNEVTFDTDTLQREVVEGTLMALSEKVSARLRQSCLRGRTVTLKIRLSDFSTFSRSLTLDKATYFCEDIFAAIKKVYNDFPHMSPVRLVGVKVSNLTFSGTQIDIFTQALEEKRERLSRAVDRVNGKFGDGALSRGKSFLSGCDDRLL